MPPVIGITTRPHTVDLPLGDLPAYVVERAYTTPVADAGGIPLLLVPTRAEEIPTLLDRLDGVVLTGGGDIDPIRYGGRRVPQVKGVSKERDDFELALAAEISRRRTPTLAVCRGMQLLNVALGGTLIEDLADGDHDGPATSMYESRQQVEIDAESRIASIVGTTTLEVNSLHHQGIDALAPGLNSVARTQDGVIEAVQATDEHWALTAVQWHPEYLAEHGDPASRSLFDQLIADSALERRTS